MNGNSSSDRESLDGEVAQSTSSDQGNLIHGRKVEDRSTLYTVGGGGDVTKVPPGTFETDIHLTTLLYKRNTHCQILPVSTTSNNRVIATGVFSLTVISGDGPEDRKDDQFSDGFGRYSVESRLETRPITVLTDLSFSMMSIFDKNQTIYTLDTVLTVIAVFTHRGMNFLQRKRSFDFLPFIPLQRLAIDLGTDRKGVDRMSESLGDATEGGEVAQSTDSADRGRGGYSTRENEVVSQFEHGTVQRRGRKVLDPHEQELIPIGRIRPFETSFAAYTELHSSQTATSRLWSPIASTSYIKKGPSNFNPRFKYRVSLRSATVSFKRSLCANTDRSKGETDD